MRARATLRVRVQPEEKLETILTSLEPEVKNPTSRSEASLTKKGDCIVIKVQAKDTVALRAALNAYLRWINTILNVFSMLERPECYVNSPV
jgi:tRNA threonylcarbamoyladenosine modification (KEOPS) complex  Pcc1 subunit